jgi:serine protease Do
MDYSLDRGKIMSQWIKNLVISFIILSLCTPVAVAWAAKPDPESLKAKEAASEKKEDKDKGKEESTGPTLKEKADEAKARIGTDPATQHLMDISKGFTTIAESALPAVVNVATTQMIDMKEKMLDLPRGIPGFPEELFREFFDMERPRRVQSLGSGFIIVSNDKEAFIVTNYHVIADAKKISIFLNDKTELEATLHAADERTDIAVLKVKTESLPKERRKLPTLEWGDSKKVRVGEWVLAIGNPFGLGSTVTNGIISNISRDLMTPNRNSYVDSFLQHSAQINMGNSGGCLLNIEGKVIGINSAIFSPSGGNVGIGFAIPSDIAQRTVEQLMQHGRTQRGWLGVRIQNLTDDMAESLGLKAQGAIVGSVTPGGPAHKAGIQSGDVILEFDGKAISESNRLSHLVGETAIGKVCSTKIWRKGKELILEVKVGEYEDALKKGQIDGEGKSVDAKSDQTAEALGITVGSIPEEIKRRYAQNGPLKGVVILKIESNSPALDVGLARGDIIVEANQKELNKPKDFSHSLDAAKKAKRKNILLLVMRNNEPRYVSLKNELEEGSHKSKEYKEKDSSDNSPKSESQSQKEQPFGQSQPSVPSQKDRLPEHPANTPHAAPAA